MVHGRDTYPKTKRLRQFYRGEQLLMLALTDWRGDGLSLAVQVTFYNQYVLDMGVPYPRLDAMSIVFLIGSLKQAKTRIPHARSVTGRTDNRTGWGATAGREVHRP